MNNPTLKRKVLRVKKMLKENKKLLISKNQSGITQIYSGNYQLIKLNFTRVPIPHC